MIKELKSLSTTLTGMLFLLMFSGLTGIFLWVLPGTFNIIDSGYADMAPFFTLAHVLLLILIPALSMKTFAEEKHSKTMDLLLTRPVSLWRIIANKIIAIGVVVASALLLSFTSVYTLYIYALPAGNIDLAAIAGSYLGILCFALTLIGLSVFTSSLTSNQIVAFILAAVGSIGLYYGFELLASLSASGKTQLLIKNYGLYAHIVSMQRGVINSQNLLILFSYAFLFYFLTELVLSVKKNPRRLLCFLLLVAGINMLGNIVSFRWDLTAEKRYSTGTQTHAILKQLEKPVDIQLYLDGDLNVGFARLQRAAIDLITDMAAIAPQSIRLHIIDPHAASPDLQKQLQAEGIQGILVNEKESAGKSTQKVVYPWIKIHYDEREMPISILVHHPEKSGEENLNASIENLEYRIVKGLNDLTQNRYNRKIAFLEGHAELPEDAVKDITDKLSQYYQVDRGRLSGQVGELNSYQAIIIAGAQTPFSEAEKYEIDQYLMQGGRLLWCVNGVVLDYRQLAATGESPTMANELNLEDMLFMYGIRINPLLVQDLQCLSLPVMVKTEGATDAMQALPWFYAPLLTPNRKHPITKDILHVKSEFVSTLDFVGTQPSINKTPLLYTSEYTQEVKIPQMVSFSSTSQQPDMQLFNKQSLMVAALLEGSFPSVFTLRKTPDAITNAQPFEKQSRHTKIIVVASEDIIRNDFSELQSGEIQYYPLGYDKHSQITLGNADFILNAINYLTDDAGLMPLRNKQWQLRLLDRKKANEATLPIFLLNIVFPITLIAAVFLRIIFFRKRKYRKR